MSNIITYITDKKVLCQLGELVLMLICKDFALSTHKKLHRISLQANNLELIAFTAKNAQ